MEEYAKSRKVEFQISKELAPDKPDDEVKEIDEETICNDKKFKLNIVPQPPRSRSPVTVQEWIASLPDNADNDYDDEDSSEDEDDVEARDTFTLGAEGTRMICIFALSV